MKTNNRDKEGAKAKEEEIKEKLFNIDNCIEVKRKDGTTTFAITFEKLKQKLGEKE